MRKSQQTPSPTSPTSPTAEKKGFVKSAWQAFLSPGFFARALEKLGLIPRRRALLLLFAPAPFIAASGMVPPLFYLGVILLLAAVAVVIVDVRMSPRPADFEVERVHDTKLSIWVNNRVEIVLLNRAPRAVDVQVRDEPPEPFGLEIGQQAMVAHLEGGEETSLVYYVRPLHRGDYAFGDLYVRWTSVLGLFTFQTAYPLHTPVRVYPNLLGVREYDLLVRRGQVGQMGLRLARRFGEGSEFEQLRDYLPDDDYRRISWKATARHNKLMTMEYQVERSQNILFLLDVGRHMMVRGSLGLRPWLDYAVDAVLLFSHVATSNGDRVGLLTFCDEVLYYLRPRPGRGQFYRVTEALYDVEAQPAEPDYRRALMYLRSKHRRRSLIVLFTNPGSTQATETLVTHLSSFMPHHLPLCILFSDPAMHKAAKRMPNTMRDAYERAIAEQFVEGRQTFLDRLNRRGVLTLDVPADRLAAAVINKYLEIKGQARI